ncbi:AraC family ligand binding domain-containing protein [Streptomyces lavendulocolor]|uniref:AraC family ligand binding domain-containing protein n=1 Tax=Streptomyces lavendulocolor TaxID=67316 RepID=UPI003C2D00B5
MTANPVAGVLARMPEVTRDVPADRSGALWRLAEDGRQLDANVVRLAAGTRVAVHVEPDLDVLLYVVDGTGRLDTAEGGQPLEAGCLVWLPRGSRRGMAAGPEGLAYLTVHRRRPGLSIGTASARAGTARTGTADAGTARAGAVPPGAAAPEAGAAREAGGEREGGEAACLLDRVCPDCGRLAPAESGVRFCGRCGSRLPAG